MDFGRHREKQKGIISEHKGYFHNFDLIGFFYWSIRRLMNVSVALFQFQTIKQILKVIPGISYALVYFELANDFIINIFASKRSLHTRIFSTIMAVIGSTIAILGFIFSTQLINAIGALSNIANNLWDCGTVIASRLWGKLKNNHDDEANRKADLTLAESGHKIVVNMLFFTGFMMLTNPVTLLAGGALLIGITTYSILDRCKLNPLRWVANQLFNHPFTKKESASHPASNTAMLTLIKARQDQPSKPTWPNSTNMQYKLFDRAETISISDTKPKNDSANIATPNVIPRC